MNSPFIVEQTTNLAGRIKSASTDLQRIRLLYQLTYQRNPTHDEIDLARQFVHASNTSSSSQLNAWQKYAQVLLMSDEFVFVD